MKHNDSNKNGLPRTRGKPPLLLYKTTLQTLIRAVLLYYLNIKISSDAAKIVSPAGTLGFFIQVALAS